MAAPQNSSPRVSTWTARFLQLGAINAIAIAQPLLDILGRNPVFFSVRRSTGLDILLLLFILLFGVPLIGLALEKILALRWPKASWIIHLLLLGFLSSIFVLSILPKDTASSNLGVAISLLGCALVAAAAFANYRSARMFIEFAAISLLAVPLIFFLKPGVSSLLKPGQPAAAWSSVVSAKSPVVFVLFDAFPLQSLVTEHREVDAIHFPNFARLASIATWYRNSTTVADGTVEAVPALLSGLLPKHDKKLPTAEDFPKTLFNLFDASFPVHAFEDVTQLCPEKICGKSFAPPLTERLTSLGSDLWIVLQHALLPKGLTAGLPPLDQGWKNFKDPLNTKIVETMMEVMEGAQSLGTTDEPLIEALQSESKPALFFLHLPLPHPPWKFLPSGRSYRSVSGGNVRGRLRGSVWSSDEWAIREGSRRHLMQAMFCDRILGRILDALEKKGILKDSLLVVTADHGEAFKSGEPSRAAKPGNLDEIIFTPLFIKQPGQLQSKIDDRNASLIDVLPTIAEGLGSKIPDAVDGISLLGPERIANDKQLFPGQSSTPLVRTLGELSASRSFARKASWFAPDPAGTFFPKEWSSIHHKNPKSLNPGPASNLKYRLPRRAEYSQVSLKTDSLPAILEGSVVDEKELAQQYLLAIVLNNKIVAITGTDGTAERSKLFSTIIPETDFIEGNNSIEIYLLGGSPQAPKLSKLEEIDPRSFFVTQDSSGYHLADNDNHLWTLRTNSLKGFIDKVDRSGDTILIRGWSANIESKKPATRIILFSGDRFITAVPVWQSRRDVEQSFKAPSLAISGFVLELTESVATNGPLRIFSIEGEHAAELSYPAGNSLFASEHLPLAE